MARQKKVLNDADFTGGLNLRADQFQIGAGESPDMLNVDVDPRGGVFRRNPIRSINSTALGADPVSLSTLYTSSGTAQIIAGVLNGASSGVFFSTGGNFTQISTSYTGTVVPHVAVAQDVAFIVRGNDGQVIRWNGTTATLQTSSGPTWQEDFAAPTGGFTPRARLVATHMRHLFVAYTTENSATFPNRLRWSHPNRPEDWRSTDFVDVATGQDGDWITAILPWRDHLLIFKNRSIWALYGYDASSFQLVQISREVGTVSQESVVATDLGVFFAAWPDGIFQYDQGKVQLVSDKLMPAWQDGRINAAQYAKITVGWQARTVWVSVPWQGSSVNNRTFVLDPTIGAWTAYGVGVGPSTEFVASSQTLWLANIIGSNRVCNTQVQSASLLDNFGAGDVAIPSYYTTVWYGRESIERRKIWRRPTLVVRIYDQPYSLSLETYSDFNTTAVDRIIPLTLPAAGAGQSLWDSLAWNAGVWGAAADSTVLVEGSNLGRSRGVQLKITGPSTQRWGFNALSIRYDPEEIR